jgi:transcriptional regulator with XRE-family HTH domain
MNTSLADYVQQIVSRHPGLSMRQAASQAGLDKNAVQQIVAGSRRRPRPSTLRAIADAWGTEQDYYEMLRLAGYHVPLPPNLDDPEEAEVLVLFRDLSTEARRYALEMLRALSKAKK